MGGKSRIPAARAAMAAAGLALSMAGAARAAGPADLYYERALIGAADVRCRLFTPEIGAALAASAAQARGAGLRAGIPAGQLAQVKSRALAKAASLDCRSPDLATAAGRVRSAFAAYARITRMTYAGDVAGWRADRVQPSRGVSWRLAQETRFGADSLRFGLAGRRGEPGAVVAVVRFADGARPYAARLLIRDPARAAEAYLGSVRAGASARLPLSARTAPRTAVRTLLAEARGPAEPELAEGARDRTAFRFPQAATGLIAELDPREAVSIEFVFAGRGGDVTRRAYVEVGDFAAALAFIQR